jgi:hypothetical protein
LSAFYSPVVQTVIADRNLSLGETMKVLRQFCTVTVLTIVLAQFALAEGTIHPGIIPPPPPPTACCSVVEPVPPSSGEELNNDEDTMTDLVTEAALSLVRSLLALF